MCNAEDEKTLVRPRVYHAIVADPQAPQPSKLTPKRPAALRPSAKFLFQPLEDSGRFLFVNVSEVSGNGGFVLDLICQAAFSVGRLR